MMGTQGFCIVSQSIDTSTSFGSFFFNVINSIAEQKSSLISDRTKAGLRSKSEKDLSYGGPLVLDIDL